MTSKIEELSTEFSVRDCKGIVDISFEIWDYVKFHPEINYF